MLHSWRIFVSTLALGLVAPVSAGKAYVPLFENTAIVRTVELGGTLVHVTTTYAVKALEPNQKEYAISMGVEEWKRTSHMQVKVKGQQKTLNVTEQGLQDESGYHLFNIELPSALTKGSTVNLVLETVETHATRPWPQTASQKDDQSLKYDMDLFILSPYKTDVQRTKVKSPSPNVHSFTTVEDIKDFTLESPVTKSGATITYGPYNNIPASSNKEFIEKHQKAITVHYKFDHPLIEVKKLKRAAEISHWGANLNIQDEIYLHNAGPELKGHFSRLEHQTQSFFKRESPQVIRALNLFLPSGISNTYYYDTIGNVSTSQLRVVPSAPKGSPAKRYSAIQLKPRYPLMGGWNYSFTMGWDSPLSDSAAFDKQTGFYHVEIPIMTLIPGAVINHEEFSVILPEGATDVKFVSPFPAKSNWISTTTTYLDSIGRPTLTFVYQNLTDRHHGSIFISYKVPIFAHLKKPVAVATAFFSLFMFVVGLRRIDLTLHKQKTN